MSQGETEARAVARLCVEHLAYIGLCGGVSVNNPTLSDFLVQHSAEVEALLTQVVVRLEAAGLVEWETHAQDGRRVRANAGAASFHRQPTLEKAWVEAHTPGVAWDTPALATNVTPMPPTPSEQAARERAAQDRVTRLEAALAALPAVRAAKATDQERAEARVSSTDPTARVMKMPEGGDRPASNWEFATDTAHWVILGVDLVNLGSDHGQMEPLLEQALRRYGRLPKKWLQDGGFVNLRAIEKWSAAVEILTPVPTPKDVQRDP